MGKCTQRVQMVLGRLSAIAEDESEAEAMSGHLEMMLSDMAGYDFFGTEGQTDPRGDFRDCEWDMSHVQGVDDNTEIEED